MTYPHEFFDDGRLTDELLGLEGHNGLVRVEGGEAGAVSIEGGVVVLDELLER